MDMRNKSHRYQWMDGSSLKEEYQSSQESVPSPGSALRHQITDSKKDLQRVAAAIFHSEHRTEQMHYSSL